MIQKIWSAVPIILLLLISTGQAKAQSLSWHPLGGPASANVAVLLETTNGEILAGDLHGGIFRSTDGGNSWMLAGLSDDGIRSIVLSGTGRLFAGTSFGEVGFSDDGGLTWTMTNPPGLTDIYAICVTSGGTVFASGTGGICRSDDGGTTWVQLDIGMPQIMTWSTTVTLDEQTVLSGSLGMGAVKSTNGGSTWEQIFPGSPDNIVYRFLQHQDGKLFAATALGIYWSNNEGETWSEIPDPENGDVHLVAVDASGNFLAATSTIPYRSTNGGIDWQQADEGLSDLRIASMLIRSDGILLGGTNGGGVYATAIQTWVGASAGPPLEYSLLQNYPNPFNSVTNFGFRVPATSGVSLTIYDIGGGVVATLLNETVPPGIYSYQWDATGHPSGIYLYRLRAGNSTITRKLLLVR